MRTASTGNHCGPHLFLRHFTLGDRCANGKRNHARPGSKKKKSGSTARFVKCRSWVNGVPEYQRYTPNRILRSSFPATPMFGNTLCCLQFFYEENCLLVSANAKRYLWVSAALKRFVYLFFSGSCELNWKTNKRSISAKTAMISAYLRWIQFDRRSQRSV